MTTLFILTNADADFRIADKPSYKAVQLATVDAPPKSCWQIFLRLLKMANYYAAGLKMHPKSRPRFSIVLQCPHT
jgi:hypothetical protein